MDDPNNLWITLLKTRLGPCARPVEQGFHWIAHQLSKNKISNKNNDLAYLSFHAAETYFTKRPPNGFLCFVHKSIEKTQKNQKIFLGYPRFFVLTT